MDTSLQKAALVLRQGGTVVFPTETVYGLGANALDAQAVSRIFEIKGRPHFNPLIVHIPRLDALSSVAAEIPTEAFRLAKAFWPGPLTLVLPKRDCIPDIVTAGMATVGVRVPSHPVALALLQEAGVPIAAPSANKFTRLSPTCLDHAREQLGTEVDFYVEGGRCEIGVESTIIGWIDSKATLLREGGIAACEIEALIGPLAPPPQTEKPLAPGALLEHYCPSVPLNFTDSAIEKPSGLRLGLLALQPGLENTDGFAEAAYLSQDGDLREAACNLFQKLWELQNKQLDLIVARPVPNVGLGAAINDRLKRAGARKAE